MSIRKKEMAVKYKSLLNESDGGCKAEHSLDKILLPGCYTVEIDHNGTDAGLPVEFCGEEHYIVGCLIVTDSGTAGPKQNNRVIGQSLTITTRNDKATKVYTRTLADGEWSKWYANTDENQSEDIMQLKTKVNSHAKTIPSLVSGVYWQEWPNTVDLRVNKADGTTAIHSLPAATTENAGIMTANDKVALDTATSRALRALFIAAGALYNDTDAPITRTAPWGDAVQHLAEHYYLNGLGDITETQMLAIYNERDWYSKVLTRRGMQSVTDTRTLILPRGIGFYSLWFSNFSAEILFYGTHFEVVPYGKLGAMTNFDSNNAVMIGDNNSARSFFGNCHKLRVVGFLNASNITNFGPAGTSDAAFYNAKALEIVFISKLKANLSFAYSPLLAKDSLLFMISNAAPTTAITITLHAEAYARLASDADIVAALEAQPLVSLVSA